MQKQLLLNELYQCGIRVNKKRPNVTITIKDKGGVAFNSTVPQTQLDAAFVRELLKDQKINNAEVNCHEDLTIDDFIDAINAKYRKYVPCLFVYNKIDELVIEEVDRLSRLPHSLVISSGKGWNLDLLVEEIWAKLDLVRVYTKKRGEDPNLTEALVLSQVKKMPLLLFFALLMKFFLLRMHVQCRTCVDRFTRTLKRASR